MREVLRNERKFLINISEFLRKSHELRQLLHEDMHNGTCGYMIRSLYFDTEYDSDFFDKERGVEIRKKLRLRREDAQRLIACDYSPLLNYQESFAGEYQGVYVMLENLTAGDDGARLNLSVSAKNNTFNGYLLQLNGGSEPAGEAINQFTYYSRRTAYQMEIVYPGASNLTPEIAEEISKDFSDFEKALYSYDYDTAEYGYQAYIDTESFLDYFLINELTCNYDAGRFSTYIGKDTSGKFRIYLWDMNSACDNYQETQYGPEGFQLQDRPWYVMLTKDEDFKNALIDRYWELRETWFDEDYLLRYIDETVAYLGDAVDRNYEVWGYTFEPEYDLLTPAERNPRSYEEAVAQLKTFLVKRIAWMDGNIDTLRQYSAESKVKKFNENGN